MRSKILRLFLRSIFQMKKSLTYVPNVRVRTLLYSSIAVLMTACGGTVADTPTSTASTGVESASVSEAIGTAGSQTAAVTAESAGTGAFDNATLQQSANTIPANRLLASISSASTSISDQVAGLFRKILGREPDSFGLDYYTQKMNAGMSIDEVIASLTTSTEFRSQHPVNTVREQVATLFRTILDREPDSFGLDYYTQRVNAGMSVYEVATSMRTSAEYLANHPSTETPPSSPTIPTSPSTYNLYVSTSGADTNNGTQSSPYKTIAQAASVAKAGTTIHVAAGIYSGNVNTKASGTSSNRIRFVSDTKWGAQIIGSGTEAMWSNSGDYVDITGFDISGPGRHGILNNGSNTLMSNNHIHDITVSGGCTGGGGAGIVNANYSGSNGDVIGNVVHDIGKPGGCNGVQGIYSANKGGQIMNNVVYRASSYGIHLWHAATDVLIANNTVFANGSSSMGGGIVIGAGDAPGGIQVKNTKVINNIVYNNARAGIMQYCYSGQSCIGSGNETTNNLVYGNGSAISLKTGSATGTVSADPKFVSYSPTGTGDYRLQSDSPAVNKGTSSSAPASDILGTARPKGGAVDIGAYESY